jgi:DNA mismatch repair ATPase MutS
VAAITGWSGRRLFPQRWNSIGSDIGFARKRIEELEQVYLRQMVLQVDQVGRILVWADAVWRQLRAVIPDLEEAIGRVYDMDVHMSFATLADDGGYTKPIVDDSYECVQKAAFLMLGTVAT